ncbi:DNA polymerase II large subunit [Natrinema pellirubrum DSM 15624]|uniref:DNA polymerase II large subunit n=1 Tax=Natrinema pellirubrum (strain DSM 15624 / CIP 106293 / JCM 10476 / NCIMB 786 / 157) TaxID=797303 RepID=L0JSE1_NATP1|nr:DNA polymerase II large subunit [Natrinema pellirubrum]AGB33567.1 DNA polymerase type II, large subunit [Natrinema pellirubrum DSM 15624]ELY70664.1 DNA polymerase II large subunit [Natrinema pellirubrum DSM 15624]
MREEDEQYFERLEDQLESAFDVAERAKERGGDPKPEVEIPTARDMADRVENILGIDGVAERVRELEGKMSREEAALELAEDFAEGRVGDYETKAGKVEGAVRTAVALLTEGVVAAPIEGIDKVEILENDDGTEFVNVYYAGPIRSAGGTAQALSVLVADYTRALVGIDQYGPREEEIERYAEEIALYDKETGLQYCPKAKEAKFIAKHLPIMLDGEATGDEEVSGFRDLERVDTNSARGGMCLVLGEGIALKAPKIQRYTRNLDEIDWPWLQDLIDGNYYDDGDADDEADGDDESDESETDDEADASEADAADEPEGPPRVDTSEKFLRDLIAGRPVFSHPCAEGGFRLRYGRARNHGFATAGVHPAAMHLVDDFLATGTQIKTERPGKAAGVVPVDSIEGPTVKLANGDVRRIDDPEDALEIRNGVEKILDLGEYLVNYGEFVENNHPLAPASYTYEWWVQDLAAAGADVQALEDDPRIDLEFPDPEEALEWATEYDAPLHPEYTYLWHDISVDAFRDLAAAVAEGRIERDGDGSVNGNGDDSILVLASDDGVADALETIVIEHRQRPDDDRIEIDDWRPFVRSVGCEPRQAVADGAALEPEQQPSIELERTWTDGDLSERARTWGHETEGDNAIEAVNEVAPFRVRERAPTRIGNRMGRPEKSESRDLSPAVHTLFPIGEAGGTQRNVADAAKHAETMSDTPGVVELEVGRKRCDSCGTETFKNRCPDCEERTTPDYRCPDCDQRLEPDEAGRVECDHCEREGSCVETREIDVNDEFRSALESVGERENAFEILKGVKGLSSQNKVPEPIEKGILRAKHDVSAFKDGTVRYDMTDLPVTSVRASELDVDVGQLQALGYEEDIHGEPLTHEDQLVELKVQDIVLSDGAAEHMLQTADFIDDLLEQYYGLESFYEFEDRQDLVGELVFGMAPHTSAATVGRVIGFTSAAVGYAHPYFHAAKRRNCFHPDTEIWYRDEADEWHHGPIETLVEERLDDPESDDFGTLVQELDGDVAVPSIDDSGSLTRKPVEAVSKHPAPDHLVRLETRSGREITLTPDHEVHVYEDGQLQSKRAAQLTTEDHAVVPEHLDVVDTDDDPRVFDLLDEFLEVDSVDPSRLMIKGLEKDRLYELFEDRLGDGWDGQFYPLTSTAEYFDLSKKTFSNYLYRESFPADLLLELFDSRQELLEFVPADVQLGMRRDRTEIDRFVELNERVSTLLGYYAAEGFAREQETPKGAIHQTTICGTEAEARDFYIDVFREEFGTEPYRENEAKVTVSGRLTRVFFDSVLKAGIFAETKRVPQPIFDASDEIVAAYLRGYFSGDGGVDANALLVSATTVSAELKEDLLALLSRLGICGRATITDPVPLCEKFPDFYELDDPSMSAPTYVLDISSEDASQFAEIVGFHLSRKDDLLQSHVEDIVPTGRRVFDGGDDAYLVEPISSVEYIESTVDSVYCLTVAETHSLVANNMSQKQCDGDEDCVMLLLDGLLNFSKSFLPDQRGGKMDAPLVMSSRIDPSEIDDEAHNMDVVSQYPREFFLATREQADPEDVDIEIAEVNLGTDLEYTGFDHTHDTTDIAMGPDLSAYKTLGSMMDKMDAQLELSRKLEAVDETDVAERVIEYHFLPDLIGNLRAFSRQETRCLDCGEKFRRMPLTGDCRECGGRVNLTVHKGSVNKYMQTAIQVADEYDCRPYTKQRLEVLERSLESIFENDKNKQSGIEDFM